VSKRSVSSYCSYAVCPRSLHGLWAWYDQRGSAHGQQHFGSACFLSRCFARGLLGFLSSFAKGVAAQTTSRGPMSVIACLHQLLSAKPRRSGFPAVSRRVPCELLLLSGRTLRVSLQDTVWGTRITLFTRYRSSCTDNYPHLPRDMKANGGRHGRASPFFQMAEKINTHFLHFFGIDIPFLPLLCHCFLLFGGQ
jgi:hypothetical protein